MNSQKHLQLIGTWLNDLAVLTAGNQPVEDVKTRITAMATLLLGTFGPEAFTRKSLEAVARECKFWPSYAELCDHLRDHLPGRGDDPFAAPRLGFDRQSEADKQADVEANIAASWASMQPGDVKAKIRALDGHPFRAMLGRILGKAVTKHAPQHASLLPIEFLPPGDNDNIVPFPGGAA